MYGTDRTMLLGTQGRGTGGFAGGKPPIRFRNLEKVRVRPQSLAQICLRRVAHNFLSYNNLQLKLGKQQMEDFHMMLDLDMPLPEAALRISEENYWRRRTHQKHRNAQAERHGMSWKQTYLELELQEALERLPVTVEYGSQELEALKRQVQASRLHVFQLHVAQLPSHLDLSFMFDALPALCTLAITYGNKRLGMDYERAMFGMKISDAQYLARTVRVSQTLVSLSLPCNMIDDELVKVLMGGLSYGHMLTWLDLSHNKIGDRGARRLAALLDPDYCLQSLDLSDNQIHANGCMHLGAHLAENSTCQTLNLRLNRCEDNGVSHLFQDLSVNKYLRVLNLSCNDLTARCLPYMSSMLADNASLAEIDLSANPLHQAEEDPAHGATSATASQAATLLTAQSAALLSEGATELGVLDESLAHLGIDGNGPLASFAKAVVQSTSLLRIDVRQCGLPPELAERIGSSVKRRDLRSKGISVEAYERSKLQQWEELQREEEALAQAEASGTQEAGEEASMMEKAEGEEDETPGDEK